MQQTLRELDLSPSAALLIIPATGLYSIAIIIPFTILPDLSPILLFLFFALNNLTINIRLTAVRLAIRF